jgi:hypothetical protein
MYVYPQVRTTLASAVEAQVTAGPKTAKSAATAAVAAAPGPHGNQDQLVEGLIRTLNLILETLNTNYPVAYQAIREVVKKDALVHHRHSHE